MATGVLEKRPFTGIRMEGKPTDGSGLIGICQALPMVGWSAAFGVSATRSTRIPSSRIQSWNVCRPTLPDTDGRGPVIRLVVHDQTPYWLVIKVIESAVLVTPSMPA